MHSLSLSLSMVGTGTIADQTPIVSSTFNVVDGSGDTLVDESGNKATDQ